MTNLHNPEPLTRDNAALVLVDNQVGLMTGVREGFDAYVAVDACGTFNMTKRETALFRLTQAGVVVADGASLMIEILADNASAEAGDVYAALGMDWSVLVGQVRSSAA